MNPEATTTRMSDEQRIAQFVERLHDEYTKAEVELAADGVEARADGVEARNDTAVDYSNTQIVAPWDGESPLEDSHFVRVSCRELSAGSVSFWMAEKPKSPYFVIVFKTNDETAFIKARVAGAMPDMTMDNEIFLVNAEFDGRVDLDFMPSLVTAQ